MTDKLDLEAIQQCLREWLEHADTTPRDHSLVFNLLTIDLPALVAEVERLRTRVKELEAQRDKYKDIAKGSVKDAIRTGIREGFKDASHV